MKPFLTIYLGVPYMVWADDETAALDQAIEAAKIKDETQHQIILIDGNSIQACFSQHRQKDMALPGTIELEFYVKKGKGIWV